MPPHIFEVGLKVNTKVYLDVLKSVVIPWCNQVAGSRPWVWQQDSAPAHTSKETQDLLQKECYDFVAFSHWPPPPPRTWTHWTTSFDHTSRTSPTWSWAWGCPRGVMVKAMDWGIVVREFVLQSRYYVHFRANTLGKGMNPLILPPAMDK